VLLAETLAALAPRPGERFADCTLGGAGHAAALLERLGPEGFLVAMDFDGASIPAAAERLAAIGHPHAIRQGNFAGLPNLLAELDVPLLDGLVADLGMSSMQVDEADRGFSFMREGPLDMRMDRGRGQDAGALLDRIPPAEFAAALADGDEPAAARLAAAILTARRAGKLNTTRELAELVRAVTAPVERVNSYSPHRRNLASVARVFQTLRILVNREFANLERLMAVLPSILAPGGRAAIISFHSGEDRRVKSAFREGLRAGIYSAVAADPVRATPDEAYANPRARSAKLRWAIRAAD
jgi:16S rRNA (cytosine1402-N4)-methyltransferase